MKVRITLELEYPARVLLRDVADEVAERVVPSYGSNVVSPTAVRVTAIREIPDDRP